MALGGSQLSFVFTSTVADAVTELVGGSIGPYVFQWSIRLPSPLDGMTF